MVAIVQTDSGNASFARRVHDAGRAGANTYAVDHLLETVDFSWHIKGVAFNGGQNKIARGFECAAADGVMAGADDNFVDAPRTGFAGFAKAGLHTGLRLQFQCHVFKHMACPSALCQSLQKAATFTHAAAVLYETWQHGRQTFVEAWQGVGGGVFQVADVDQRLHDRTVSPNIGAAQMGHAQKLDVFGVHA
jgi:hypothetical protein